MTYTAAELKKHVMKVSEVKTLKFYNDGKYDTPRRYFDLDGITYAIAVGAPTLESLVHDVRDGYKFKIIREEKPSFFGIRHWYVYREHVFKKD